MAKGKQASARVILITHEFYPYKGGISIYIQEMAKCIAGAGYKLEVWAPRHEKLLSHSFPYPVVPLPLKGNQGWPSRLRLARFLIQRRKELSESILYLPEPGPLRTMLYLQLFKMVEPHRLLLTLHGSEILLFSAFPHRRILFRKLLEKAERIGVVSNFNRQLLKEIYPTLRSEPVLSPGALRSGLQYEPRSLSGKSEPVILLTVGRIHPRKGQMFVLKALRKLPREVRDHCVYWIVGGVKDAMYYKKISRYAEAENLRIKFFLNREDEDLSEIYRQADIFIMPSIRHKNSIEGFGLTYLEASAFGLPVIAFRSGGVEDAVENNVTGYLCDPADPDRLPELISLFIKDPNLRGKLGEAGTGRARRFSWRESFERLFSAL